MYVYLRKQHAANWYHTADITQNMHINEATAWKSINKRFSIDERGRTYGDKKCT